MYAPEMETFSSHWTGSLKKKNARVVYSRFVRPCGDVSDARQKTWWQNVYVLFFPSLYTGRFADILKSLDRTKRKAAPVYDFYYSLQSVHSKRTNDVHPTYTHHKGRDNGNVQKKRKSNCNFFVKKPPLICSPKRGKWFFL